jgi:hypothetical protein
MGANPEQARRVSVHAFKRASALWMERRDPLWFETWLLRYSIRATSRRERFRGIVALLRWWKRKVPGNLPHSEDPDVRGRLVGLRPRLRAVAVLVHYRGLSLGEVADVLQTSTSRAESLHSRALDELGASADDGAELTTALSAAAASVSLPDLRWREVERTHRVSKIAGAAVIVAVAAGVGAGILGAVTLLRTTGDEPSRISAPPVRPVDRISAPEIPPSELLGAPAWCPSRPALLPFSPNNGVEAVGVATRLNVGLINGYGSSIRHLVERSPGAPQPTLWPTTTGDSGLRVVASVSAEANSLLAARCGHLVARRTWEVILEDPGPPQHDGVAIYLVKRHDGINVWGTYAGSAE